MKKNKLLFTDSAWEMVVGVVSDGRPRARVQLHARRVAPVVVSTTAPTTTASAGNPTFSVKLSRGTNDSDLGFLFGTKCVCVDCDEVTGALLWTHPTEQSGVRWSYPHESPLGLRGGEAVWRIHVGSTADAVKWERVIQ